MFKLPLVLGDIPSDDLGHNIKMYRWLELVESTWDLNKILLMID